jgi:hypothetical protein
MDLRSAGSTRANTPIIPKTRSIAPEILETRRRQLRVPAGVLDVLVAEIGLQRAGIDAVVSELVAAGVPQHVGMDDDVEAGGLAQAGDHFPGSPPR